MKKSELKLNVKNVTIIFISPWPDLSRIRIKTVFRDLPSHILAETRSIILAL